MEQAIKQRIIGIVVLVSLALIFIPILFSNEIPADERITSSINLPSPPTVPNFKESKKYELAQPAEQITDTVNIPEVWVVQLGVFKDKTNAESLIKDLRAKGFPAFTKLSKTGKDATTRVFIGPEIDRQKATTVALKLEKIFNIHGMVVRHKL